MVESPFLMFKSCKIPISDRSCPISHGEIPNPPNLSRLGSRRLHGGLATLHAWCILYILYYIYYNYSLSWPDVGPSHKIQGTFKDMHGSMDAFRSTLQRLKTHGQSTMKLPPGEDSETTVILPSLNQTWLAGNYFVRKSNKNLGFPPEPGSESSEAVLSYRFAEGVTTKIKKSSLVDFYIYIWLTDDLYMIYRWIGIPMAN